MDTQGIITINQDRNEMTADLMDLKELSGEGTDGTSIEEVTLPIETRTIASTAKFKGKEKTFTHQNNQSTCADSLRAIWVDSDNSVRTLNLLASHDDAPPVMNGRWDWVLAPGILQKVIHNRPDDNESSKVVRISINRQAIANATDNGEVLYILEYEARNGTGENPEWNSTTMERATKLVISD
jgi:hypothetical protein